MKHLVTGLLVITPMLTGAASGADFPYSVETSIRYLDALPQDGHYERNKFIFSGSPQGFSPKKVDLIAELSTGPGKPMKETVTCAVGEVVAGSTTIYGVGSCNDGPAIISVPKGERLYARMSVRFAPMPPDPPGNQIKFSNSSVVLEKVAQYPVASAKECKAVTGSPVKGKTAIRATLYALNGAVSPTGEIDTKKLCLSVSSKGAEVNGLVVQGAYVAIKGNTKTVIGGFRCALRAPLVPFPADTAETCGPYGNNEVPLAMRLPAGAKLYIALHAAFGHFPQRLPSGEGWVQPYAPTK